MRFPTLRTQEHIVRMRLPFRHRLFLDLVLLSALWLGATLIGLALYERTTGSPAGPRASLDEIAASGRQLIETVDTMQLDSAGRAAISEHAGVIAERTILARRAERLYRSRTAVLGTVSVIVAAVLVGLSLVLARRWSGSISAPVEELVGWVRNIERGERLPDLATGRARAEPPELGTLRAALVEMAGVLETAKAREVERERLQAFRETARRVAHEMRGPLNAAQLALGRLAEVEGSSRHATAVTVLREETERLRRLADEFAIFGRLPEGPETEVDVAELIEGVVAAAVPADCPVRRSFQAGLVVRVRYELLRRGVENVVRNAVEATDDRGIVVRTSGSHGTVRITVADHGSGVARDDRERIFQPYTTTKAQGTGLGLTIAHQAATSHGGTLTVDDEPGGGAGFTFTLPAA